MQEGVSEAEPEIIFVLQGCGWAVGDGFSYSYVEVKSVSPRTDLHLHGTLPALSS